MQAVDSVADSLGHPANTAGDNGPTMQERLLNHERRILPPDRRHDDPIDRRDQSRKLLAAIGAEPNHVGIRLLEQLLDLLDEFLGLERSAAMEAQLEILDPGR